MKKTFPFILLGLTLVAAAQGLQAQDRHNMEIITTDGLTYYYPHFSRVGLAVGEMPQQNDTNVIFVAAAAFTGQLLDSFQHTNIAGKYISNGKAFDGYPCTDVNTGRFVYYNQQWKFDMGEGAEAYERASQYADGASFAQCMLVYNGALCEDIPLRAKFTTERKGLIYYRALCEQEGRLCIVESEGETTFAEFLVNLAASGVKYAIYMDGNSGWNYSWYRNDQSEVVEIHPETARSRYCTNWVVFFGHR